MARFAVIGNTDKQRGGLFIESAQVNLRLRRKRAYAAVCKPRDILSHI